MLSPVDAIGWLSANRLVAAEDVLFNDLCVESLARRNRNLRVSRSNGVGYILKQPDDPFAGGTQTLRHEAAFYSFCAAEPVMQSVRSYIPQLVLVDFADSTVVIEFVEGTCTPWEFYARQSDGQIPGWISAALGKALGTLHRASTASVVLTSSRSAWLPRSKPWILQFHRPSPDILSSISAANYETIRILQTYPGLVAELDKINTLWEASCIIHGDIKADNILISNGPATDMAGHVRIIDWELVQYGDPAWDVAGVLQDYVQLCIASMPHATTVSEMLANEKFRLPMFHPSMRNFMRNYFQAAETATEIRQAFVKRAVLYTGVRLIQSAFERSSTQHSLPVIGVLLLQISTNVLTDVEGAQLQLFGLYSEEP